MEEQVNKHLESKYTKMIITFNDKVSEEDVKKLFDYEILKKVKTIELI